MRPTTSQAPCDKDSDCSYIAVPQPPSSCKCEDCGLHPPAKFWDDLSTTWLTTSALRELDRRNIREAQLDRPIARCCITTWKQKKEDWRPSQPASDYLSSCTKQRVKDIKSLARPGRLDLTDLRGYRIPGGLSYRMDPGPPQRGEGLVESTETTTKKSRPYDRNFQQNLIDGRIYPNLYEHPNGTFSLKPTNLGDIREILARPLSSLRLSDEEFQHFLRADDAAKKEKQVGETVIPFLEGIIRKPQCRGGGIPFTNLAPLTNGTIVSGNPDIFYGARPEQLIQQIRDELNHYIRPSTQNDVAILPNFFVAIKGPDGLTAVAKRQACYDGALGARGMHQLRQHGQGDCNVYDNKAYTLTSIYHDGILRIYATHLTPPSTPEGIPQYHTTQVSVCAMTDDYDSFVKGVSAFRNGIELAQRLRNEVIQAANERFNRAQMETTAANTSNPIAISTSLPSFRELLEIYSKSEER